METFGSHESFEWEKAKEKQRTAIADKIAGRLTQEEWTQSQKDFQVAVEKMEKYKAK